MSTRSPRLRIVRVEFGRGPASPAWTQLMARLLREPKKEQPAGTPPRTPRAEEETDGKPASQ